jgi:hypothetical protein
MTFDPHHVKNAIADATGIVLGDAEVAAIAERLDAYRRAAAPYLDREAADTTGSDFKRALDAAAPRHG